MKPNWYRLGAEKTLGAIGPIYRDAIFEQSGMWIRNSIHGLDIFEDRENVRFVSGEATIQTLINPAKFFDEVQKYHFNVDALTPTARDISTAWAHVIAGSTVR